MVKDKIKDKKKKKEGLSGALFKSGRSFFSTVFLIFRIISLLGLIISVGGAVYAYNFVPIKTIGLCLSDKITDLPIDIECSIDEECSEGFAEIIKNETIKDGIENNSGRKEIIEISGDIMEGFIKTISEETIKCIEGECKAVGVENFEEILGQQEKRECLPDEEKKEVKITLKKIVPPGKLFGIMKKVVTSSEIRNAIIGFIKTGSFPEDAGQE